MKHFLKIAAFLLILSLGIQSASSQSSLNLSQIGEREELMYDIYYNWGMIWKKAGEGRFILESSKFEGNPVKKVSLYGRTLSIVESLFPVRDTLISYIDSKNSVPKYYTKIINEGGYEATDIIRYSYPADSVVTKVREIRSKGEIRDTLLSSKDPIYDMLTVFYYLRSIELQKARINETFPAVVVTGRHLYKLKFKFLGMYELKVHKKENKRICYKVQLLFENSFGQIDDDTMIVFIGDDEARTPIQLEAKLRIGYLRAILRE
ncbi:DUF3108 domain-containing protein [Porphyromonadaceae bacterium]